eukprot:CAMPEP_0172159364 /NCGR_PEP_ID=MMETSP1050-20130122/4920_1 /TAXON_ID=233186 /ORGANISM="Cryptomonas curvata, Strain CCAP979/52" /LENGTH=66 /DNA_ID=CAMNT_0012828925 /DNA_START=396 /DNA_END=596 /DNA_ORIENTATION=-
MCMWGVDRTCSKWAGKEDRKLRAGAKFRVEDLEEWESRQRGRLPNRLCPELMVVKHLPEGKVRSGG